MLKFYNYDIVFQEVPDEVTLAVNITNCPNFCKGCHSSFLQEDTGELLDEKAIDILMNEYGSSITCFGFMGGDRDPEDVEKLSVYVRDKYKIKTAWYSGKPKFAPGLKWTSFDYVKIGPYIAEKGPLKSKTTNQRFYAVKEDGTKDDLTYKFYTKPFEQ